MWRWREEARQRCEEMLSTRPLWGFASSMTALHGYTTLGHVGTVALRGWARGSNSEVCLCLNHGPVKGRS